MKIALRDFEETDISEYTRMQKNINASEYMSRFYPDDYEKNGSNHFFKSIVMDNEFIGVIYFEPDLDQSESYYLGIMIGKRELQGKGIGKLAIELGIDALKAEREVKYIKLNVIAENKRAVNCYLKIGFEIFNTYYKQEKKCYSMKYNL